MVVDYNIFPALNAGLNGASAVLIAAGRLLIGRKQVRLHRICMIAALATSTLFLACYLFYHVHVRVQSMNFPGHGLVRVVYFTILISHTILAITVVPLVAWSLNYALRGNFVRHRRVVRWAYPIWLYVSITGVLVYVILYPIYGARV